MKKDTLRDMLRKEAVERITGPDDLNTYVKALTPRVWMLLAGVAIAVAGLVIFVASTGFPIWELFFGNF